TGQCLKTFTGHGNWVWSVAFNAIPPSHGSYSTWGDPKTVLPPLTKGGAGGIIASGSEDRTVRLWSLDNGQCLKVFQGYTNTVFSMAFAQNPVGTHHLLASGYFDRVIRLWNTKDGQSISFRGHIDAIRAVALSPLEVTGEMPMLLASGGGRADRTVKLWSVKDGQCLRTLSGHTNEIWSVAFSQDGQILASSSSDRTIRLWSTQTGECLRILEGHAHWVMSVAFSPIPPTPLSKGGEGGILASASFDRTIKFWDWHTGECLQTLQGHQLDVCSIAFSPVESILASGSADRTVRLWDVNTGECLKVLSGHTALVWSVALSLDGKLLASGGFDQTVRLWDVHTGECLQVLQGHTNVFFSVAFVPQHGVNLSPSQFLASAGDDESIRLWDVETGECVETFRPPKPYEGMNILGAKGLTEAQKETLKALGAVES
ncbi:MAG: WD40 repeat domain-containing protein, partial [Microcystaceae cyanobacterium]